MNKMEIKQLKKELDIAIDKKDYMKIVEIRTVLQEVGQNEMTGYASVDMPWLKYYSPTAYQDANAFPTNKIVWDVIEESIKQYGKIPVIQYFGRKIYSDEFIDNVYRWASIFKEMGVDEDEVIAIYSPFLPEICVITFALNIIGATPYFLKLAIEPEALAEETKESKIAIVFDDMWKNVDYEFSKKRFEKVLFVSVLDGMPSPQRELVASLNLIKGKKRKNKINIDGLKYINVKSAIRSTKDNFTDDIRAKFVSNRRAFITSSSGTSGKVVKGAVATNETTISQLYMCTASEMQYPKGGICLNNFPPTASTSLNALFFLPLFRGLTIIIDPRISAEHFYNQLITLKPNISIATGSLWETFFNKVEEDIKGGKAYDFRHATGWVVGGEGTDPHKLNRWNKLMLSKCNAPFGICSGYGSSELFSAVSSDTHRAVMQDDRTKAITAVGVPLAGLTLGVFDENGNELPYGQRGELRVKSPAAMKEYYGKEKLTSETKINGWIHTGDIAEIDNNGFLYVWGRKSDCIKSQSGREMYPFDIAGVVLENDAIRDAMILPVDESADKKYIAHIAWEFDVSDSDKESAISDIFHMLSKYLPKDVEVIGYKSYGNMLPYSPTTFKKDRYKMFSEGKDYIKFMQ